MIHIKTVMPMCKKISWNKIAWILGERNQNPDLRCSKFTVYQPTIYDRPMTDCYASFNDSFYLFIYLKESRIIKSKYSNTSSYWIFKRKINKERETMSWLWIMFLLFKNIKSEKTKWNLFFFERRALFTYLNWNEIEYKKNTNKFM